MPLPTENTSNTTFDPYKDIPAYFHGLLIPHNGPSYLEARQADLHRYALLHRRFTNQILYGCRNPSCNTRTCLSFRKRIATRPVRIYSTTAAQALAARCLDRLANDWRKIADEEELRWKHSGVLPGTRTSELHGTGLCANPGVVPWYEDGEAWLAKQKVNGTVLRAEDKYDHASLVQFITRAPQVQRIYALTGAASQDRHGLGEELLDRKHDHSLKPSRMVFGELTPSVLSWLVYESRRREAGVAKAKIRLSRNDAFGQFVVDTVAYCLGNYTPLTRSFFTWAQDTGPNVCEKSASDMHAYIQELRLQESTGAGNEFPPCETTRDVCRKIYQSTLHLAGQDFVVRCLMKALQQCYNVPHELRKLAPRCYNDRSPSTFLSDCEVAQLICITLDMLTVFFDTADKDQIATDLDHQQSGRIFPRHHFESDGDSDYISAYLKNNLWVQIPIVREYTKMIADIIAHRIAIDGSLKRRRRLRGENYQETFIVERIVAELQNAQARDPPEAPDRRAQLLKLMRSVMIFHWDRGPVIKRTSAVGGALEIMAYLYEHRFGTAFDDVEFYQLRFVTDTLKDVETLEQWLSFRADSKKMHILQHRYLLKPKRLVRFFRAINLKRMQDSYLKAKARETIANEYMIRSKFPVPSIEYVLDEIRPGMAPHFVMTIRRSHVLEDAIGQIWRREQQELMRPLKVKLGQEDGEQGIDYGGVQQEFFRLVFAEAFDVKYGMFEIDPTTYMTWFKPGFFEPLYKFEVIGILMALAIYNGVTLPLTMPTAFYEKLLRLQVDRLGQIGDGWPELAKSFDTLLAWTDGDVADSMGRTYEFSYEHLGQVINIDLSKTSTLYASAARREGDDDRGAAETTTPVTGEAPLVNNQTRGAYVSDYIRYLIYDSIEPQFSAFHRGFQKILPSKLLSIFDPETLRLLVEGQPYSQPLNVQELRAATIYEGYTPDHSVIQWFWEVVGHEFSEDQKRKLLAFVTASDRVPIGGLKDVRFVIQMDGMGEAGTGADTLIVLDSHSMQESDFAHEQESESENMPGPEEDMAVPVSPSTPARIATESNLPLHDSFTSHSNHDESNTPISVSAEAEDSLRPAPPTEGSTKKQAIRLPGSSTCYGRLLLPAYGSKEILREKLCLAIENSMGFGVL